MKSRNRVTRIFPAILIGLFVFTGGCAGTSQSALDSTETNAEQARDDRDPFERSNRAMLNFNFKVDRAVLKPAAKGYAKLPQPVRNGIGNFFSNLSEPKNILYDLLQGKFGHAGQDAGRLVINTLLGAGGLMDVASEMGLPQRDEDLGQTLAVWGVPAGPYLVLPLKGPSNLRDSSADLVSQFTIPEPLASLDWEEELTAQLLELVDGRAERLSADQALAQQPDKYLFLRELYRQRRANEIYDGNPPGGNDDELLLDELLEEEDAE